MEEESVIVPSQPESPAKTNYRKILIPTAIILLILISVIYALNKNKTKPLGNTEVARTSPSPTPNLNPNTGTLYGDIKVRLNEVLK